MRFLADMGVSPKVVDWPRSEGHDATHLRDHGLVSLPDEDVFAKAVGESRVLLTFDLDFGEIVALSHAQAVGVIVFRLHNTRTDHVIERLRHVLGASGQRLEQGAVVVVEESRHRVRPLPIDR